MSFPGSIAKKILVTGLAGLLSIPAIAQEEQVKYISGYNDYVLLVYEDTECPACSASFDATFKATSKLGLPLERIIFPVTTGRLESENEGMLSHCIRKHLGPKHQSAVVQALHRTNLTEPEIMVEELATHAPEFLGGRMEKGAIPASRGKEKEVLACLKDADTYRSIEQSIEMGLRYGVSGTPTYQLINWKTLGTGMVEGVPNTEESLIEWINNTAVLTAEVGQTDEIETNAFLEANPVLRPIHEDYKGRTAPPPSEMKTTPDEVRGVIQELFKNEFDR